jgi:hypothetical protein
MPVGIVVFTRTICVALVQALRTVWPDVGLTIAYRDLLSGAGAVASNRGAPCSFVLFHL